MINGFVRKKMLTDLKTLITSDEKHFSSINSSVLKLKLGDLHILHIKYIFWYVLSDIYFL